MTDSPLPPIVTAVLEADDDNVITLKMVFRSQDDADRVYDEISRGLDNRSLQILAGAPQPQKQQEPVQ